MLLHADSSAYFGLNRSGTRLWAELAERAMTLEQLAAWAGTVFPDAPPPDDLTAEISAFLDALGELNLLRREDGGAVPPLPPGTATAAHAPWAAPAVERFGELEKLILSGE